MEVHTLTSNAELIGLESAWNGLFDASGERSVFLSYDWVTTWWRHFGGDREPLVLVLVLGDSAAPAGILPLRRSWRPGIAVGTRVIEALAAGPSDATGGLFHGDPAEIASALTDAFQSDCERWDQLDLRDLVLPDALRVPLCDAFAADGIEAGIGEDNPCPVMPLAGDFETLCAEKVGRRKRRGNTRSRNRLAEMGELRFRTIGDAAAALEAFERVLALDEHDAYQGEHRVRPFDGERGSAFFRDVITAFAKRDWLRMYTFEVADRLVAYDIGFRHGGRHSCYYGGYDSELSRLSPGRLLTLEVIRDAYADGIDEIDFLRGDEAWKREWTDETRHTLRLRVHNSVLSSRIRIALQR